MSVNISCVICECRFTKVDCTCLMKNDCCSHRILQHVNKYWKPLAAEEPNGINTKNKIFNFYLCESCLNSNTITETGRLVNNNIQRSVNILNNKNDVHYCNIY